MITPFRPTGHREEPIMNHALLASACLLVLLATTSGCSRYYWSKPGATAEQFTGDNRECVQQAAASLPPGAAVEAVEQVYRACLNGRGYVRDKQIDPPPLGSYRGIESSEAFAAAARAGQAPRQSFEQQLAQLDDLKARGRITDDEYATMRRRLVEGATPAALTPAPAVTAAPPPLAGRWYGRTGSILDIRTSDGRQLEWDWEISGDRGTSRATGTGSATGSQVSLTGRLAAASSLGARPTLVFSLAWDGAVLRGTSRGSNNLPVNVEFTRDRP
jgi:hypothetical protein